MLWPGGGAALGAIAVAVVSAASFAAGWRWQGERMTAAHERAQLEAIHASEASNRTIIEAYRAELDRSRNRPARRLLVCPDLPAAAGATAGPDPDGIPAGAGQSARSLDLAPILAECRDYVVQLDTLIHALRAQSP